MKIEDFDSSVCLHESLIKKIETIGSSLVLRSEWQLHKHNDTNTNNGHDIIIKIKDFTNTKAYEHVTIYSFTNNKRKEIDFACFCKNVEKYGLIIYLTFYSSFAKGFLIKGNIKNSEIEMLITEIVDFEITDK